MGEIQEKKFNENQEKFIDFLTIPESKRGTQKDFAEKIGVTEKTLSLWKKKIDLIDEVMKRKKQLSRVEDYVEIVNVMIEKAKEGNKEWFDTYMKWIGEDLEEPKPGSKAGGNINLVFGADVPRPKNIKQVYNVEGD